MRTFLLAFACLAMAFAPAPLPRPDRGRAERGRVFGTWVLKQVNYAGSTSYSGAGIGTGVVYLNEDVTISEREMLFLKRDPNVRQPQPRRIAIHVDKGAQHIDFLQSPSPGRVLGHYKLEGAKLTIAYPIGTDKPRPTTFENTNDIVLILERVR